MATDKEIRALDDPLRRGPTDARMARLEHGEFQVCTTSMVKILQKWRFYIQGSEEAQLFGCVQGGGAKRSIVNLLIVICNKYKYLFSFGTKK